MLSHRTLIPRMLLVCFVVATLLSLLGMPRQALAAPLSPGAFASLGTLNLAPGAYTIDTTTLTFSGPGPVSFTGVASGSIAVFTFTSITIPSGATIKATGSRPLALLSQGNIALAGVIDGSGASSGGNFSGGGGALGGPGGGRGGAAINANGQAPAGSGPGGGGGANGKAGAGGGGFGGAGARGATVSLQQGAGGGIAYGDLLALLQGGSGGGGAWTTQGAGGGGGLEIGASGEIAIGATGAIKANGGDASVGGQGSPGGGSGGGILIHADTLASAGQISANGGQGGRGSCCGAGGGGGGGRIVVVARTTSNTGTVSAAGGTSGTGFNGNCAGGTCAPGTPSPDPTGAAGQILGGQAIRITAGASQSAHVGSAFATPFQVQVLDLFGQPLSGVNVSFTAPASGASGTFGGSAVVPTDSGGVATAPVFTANGTPGSYTVTASVPDFGISVDFTLSNIANRFDIFVPLIAVAGTPDLVVSSVALSPATTSFAAGEPVSITVVIENQGTASAQPFWVDLYLNPSVAPALNATWDKLCGLSPCFGIAWQVARALAPGEQMTLTSTSTSYAGAYSNWHGFFAAGTTDLYVLADSWNPGQPSGASGDTNRSNNLFRLSGLKVAGTALRFAGAPALAMPARPALLTR